MKQKEKQLKKIPLFDSENEEAKFWDSVDSTSYFPGKGSVHLKMPKRTISISLRIPKKLLDRIKHLADMKDVPYQSLMKIYLDEKIRDEIVNIKKVA